MAKKNDSMMMLFPLVVILLGLVWLLNDMGIIKGHIPWWPIIVILVGFKMLMHPKSK